VSKKEIEMKTTALPILVAMMVSLMAVPAAWPGEQAQQNAADLSKKCQEALTKPSNKEGEKLCKEGIELHNQGKNDEAVAKMTQGLAKLGEVKGQKKW
jgi:hypothetical protein